jgi:spermidine synthase
MNDFPVKTHAPRMPLVDTAPIPGGGELRLFRDGAHYTIKLADGGDLMSTRQHGSEELLAQFACSRVAAHAKARVLVGGLGLGYTLAAALSEMREDAEIAVAELVPGVVKWNREWLGEFAGHPLRDVRTRVHEGDVIAQIKGQKQAWDAILLDVDNGPDGLSRASNSWLYGGAGLASARQSLRVGGVLAVWSAHSDPAFTKRLERAEFKVEEMPSRALGKRGMKHRIWLATKT